MTRGTRADSSARPGLFGRRWGRRLRAAAAIALFGVLGIATADAAVDPQGTVEGRLSYSGVPDPVVHDIQRTLAEIGLYVGPIDGIMGGETADAIRAYQRQNRLAVDGRATRALLDGMELSVQARNLDARIARTKEAQTQAALAALRASPATSIFLGGRASAERADPTRDARACFAAPSVRCLLGEALESAKGIHRDRFHDWVLGSILMVQVKAGLADVALETVRRLQDPRLVMVALRNISRAQAETGDIAAAERLALAIPAPAPRAEALAAIAVAHGVAGDLTAANDGIDLVAALCRDPSVEARRAVSILAAAAVGLAAAGAAAAASTAIAAADDRARAIGPSANRARALAEVATALAQSGQPRRALALLEETATPDGQRTTLLAVANAFAQAGDLGTALDVALDVDQARYQAVVLSDIASIEARGERATAARATMARAVEAAGAIAPGREYAVSYAWSRIVASWLVIGDNAAASEAADNIASLSLRAHALARIAAARARAGETAAAARIARRADALVDTIPSPLDRVWVLCDIALADDRDGAHGAALAAFRRALDIAKAISVPWARAQALGKTAATLLELR